MGTRRTQLKSTALAAIAAVCTVAGFQNCGKFSTQNFKDSFTSLCAGQTLSKLRALAAAAPLTAFDCHDPQAYRCNVRIFRPGVGYRRDLANQCTRDGACFDLQVMNFDTQAAAKEDHLPAGSFDEGGEYNHAVFECEAANVKVEGVSILFAEADSLENAWIQVQNACEKRSHHVL
jgi:hypothetical protein